MTLIQLRNVLLLYTMCYTQLIPVNILCYKSNHKTKVEREQTQSQQLQEKHLMKEKGQRSFPLKTEMTPITTGEEGRVRQRPSVTLELPSRRTTGERRLSRTVGTELNGWHRAGGLLAFPRASLGRAR